MKKFDMYSSQNDINELKDLTTCCPNVFKKAAFTLAEMMVVMLIMTIVLAAAAPVMTTRMKQQQSIGSGGSSIWQWVSSTKDHAYFGEGDAQMALIGQDEVAEGDSAKLIINRVDGGPTNHILFKEGDNTRARLLVTEKSIFLNSIDSLTKESNTVIGINAANNNKGSNFIAIGNNALLYGQDLDTNSIAIGNNALKSSNKIFQNFAHDIHSNIAIGNNALENATSAQYNIAIGSNALNKLSGTYDNEYNIAVGYESMAESINTSGVTNNIAIGYRTLHNAQSSSNIAIGTEALDSSDLAYGSVAIGHQALKNNARGRANVAIGYQASFEGTTQLIDNAYNAADYNTAIGYQALYKNTIGDSNTAIGYQAMKGPSFGINISFNTALGYQALSDAQGDDIYNTAVGANAGMKTGSYNTVVGANAGAKAGADYITALGYESCTPFLGENKVCIGSKSGNVDDRTYHWLDPSGAKIFENWRENEDNVERIFIGSAPTETFNDKAFAVLEVHNPKKDNTVWQESTYYKSKETVSIDNIVDIDKWYPTVVINGNLLVRGKTQLAESPLIITNDSQVVRYSDLRLKNVGSEITTGLDKIKQLKVFNYTFKKDETKTPRVGVIAQDLQKVFPDAVTKGEDGYLRIRMEDMFYAVVNAIKELDTKIAKLIETIKQNQDELKALRKENKELKEILKQVQSDNKKLEKRLNAIEAKMK